MQTKRGGGKYESKPASLIHAVTLKKHQSGRKVAKTISTSVGSYREDLITSSLGRASALRKSRRPGRVHERKARGKAGK